MMFCKNKLEEKVLGKELNKTLYIIFLITAIVTICRTSLLKVALKRKKQLIVLVFLTLKQQGKYENAKQEEIGYFSSTNVDSNIATVDASLGHYEKDKVKKYKAVN